MKHSLQQWIRIFLFLLAALVVSHTLDAQVNYTENFTSTTFPPPGWSIFPVGNPIWSQQTTGTNPTCAPHSIGGMARFNSDQAATGTNQALVLPLVNYLNRGANPASVSLWIYRSQGPPNSDSLGILINTSNSISGATRLGAIARSVSINLPDTVPTSGWYQYSFPVPASFNTAVNYVFLYGYSRHGDNIFIDDVAWVDYPPTCSGAPSAGTLSSDPAIICGGSGAALLSVNGGTTGFAGISYQWQQYDSTSSTWTNVGTGSISVSTGTITASNYYRVYVTCSNSSLTDTSTAFLMTVSPNPVPVVTVSPDTVNMCPGASPVLIVASGASNYSWFPFGGLTSVTGDSVYASPAMSTTYNVTGTDSAGCSSNASVSVLLRAAPNINAAANPDSICSGDNVNLFAQGAGMNNTFIWFPGGMTGGFTNATPTVTTTYTVTVTNIFGCSNTDSVTVNVMAAAIASFSYVINGHTVTFHDSSSNATSWQWSFGDGNFSLSANPTYTYSADGWYTVQLIVSNGVCAGDTVSILIAIGPVGIAENENSNALIVYPNPVLNIVTIESLIDQPEGKLELINSLGQVITHELISPSTGNIYKHNMDLSHLPAGCYTIRVKSSTQSIFRKVVKQ